MDFIQKQPGMAVAIAFILGLIIGNTVLGWYVFPVSWTEAPPQALAQSDQDKILRSVSELFSFDGDQDKVRNTLSAWAPADAANAICDQRANRSTDAADQERLEAIAFVLVAQNCEAVMGGAVAGEGAPAPEEPAPNEGGFNLGPVLILGLLLLVFIAAILFVIQRRNAMMSESDYGTTAAIPESAPMTGGDGDDEVGTIPLARFTSNYTYGRDTYDDSFSIENADGDFMGECGVGISESIGTDTPKNVTAFEVWLFDKNDIRTVTKVIMSDHAFFDDALKAKLAPKGEPVLAREGEVIVLETASLIINAEIKGLQYGSGALPPQSFFENFTIELSAWAKEGDYSDPDIQGRVDEVLDF
ncbi:MAG: hypothetical protein DWQ04_00870 [Chloroflexi bacterium]|nr:MAG: hypothetical protein DWQ04_00870 [Chloroflexota bacterium]